MKQKREGPSYNFLFLFVLLLLATASRQAIPAEPEANSHPALRQQALPEHRSWSQFGYGRRVFKNRPGTRKRESTHAERVVPGEE